MELIDQVDSVIIFLCQMTLLRWLTFLLASRIVILTVLLFWICFFLLMLSICSAMPFPPLGLMTIHADWDGLYDHLRDIPWGGYL